jgi:hypothetical protein
VAASKAESRRFPHVFAPSASRERGTRPKMIRLTRVIEKLDRHCTHVLVHTGQSYD